MENPTSILFNNICRFFVKCENGKFDTSKLLRLHYERLQENGDVSILRRVQNWEIFARKYNGVLQNENLLAEQMTDVTKENIQNLLTASANWIYPIDRISITNDRCILYLKRLDVMKNLLSRVLNETHHNLYGQYRKNPLRYVYIHENAELKALASKDLSYYRVEIFTATLRRLLQYSEWNLLAEMPLEATNILQLQVSSLAAKETKLDKKQTANTLTIHCGLVKDPITGKLCDLTTAEYLHLRSTDMRLLAMHKYGLRFRAEDAKEIMEQLRLAAVTVDLLEIKLTSPVQILRKGQGCTRGAAFILYNSARVETLLRKFEERVRQGVYGVLPDLEQVDLTLLSTEEEWQIIYSYIFTFPNMIEQCLDQLEKGLCATHMIIRYLIGFVSVISIYYQRTKILTDAREQLMPYVYARVYLLKAVRSVLNRTLGLIGIAPMHHM